MERLKLFVFACGFMACTAIHAVPYLVTDPGDTLTVGSFESVTVGQLRWAITQANANPSSTILFVSGLGTITLGKPLPGLIASMDIVNVGTNLAISGNN